MLAYSSSIAILNMGTPHKKHNDDHELKVLEANATHFSAGDGGGGGGDGWWREVLWFVKMGWATEEVPFMAFIR